MFKKIIANPFVFFPLLTCIIFWPLSLQLFTLKNDALTYYYPVRTLISDALHHYELPLWTPYINMGYPLHADMQSGAWNPVIWLFSLLTNYSLYGFHLELLFYFSFAGIGFYYLGKEFGLNKYACLITAMAYQYSGFMIDSIQFFVCITAACYLPWIFVYFKRLLINRQLKDGLLTGLFLSLLFTGSYPALFIISAYLLLAYLLFVFFSTQKKEEFIKSSFLSISLMALVFILLSLPAIISFAQHLPLIERGEKQSLEFVQENSLVPQSLLSFISPFSTTASETWLNTDPLMRSSYIGIIPFLFLLLAIFNKNIRCIRTVQFFFVTGLVMFMLALGSHFFLHQLAYYSLPLVNSFRHPALLRLFGIFCWLIVAGFAMNDVTKNIHFLLLIKKITIGFAITITLFGILLVIILKGFPSSFFTNDFSLSTLKNLIPTLSFTEKYLFQLPFVFAILISFYLALKKQQLLRLLFVICIADFFIRTQFNLGVTVIGAKKISLVNTMLNRNAEKFPSPGNSSIEENSKNSLDTMHPGKSKLLYEKRIGRNDYYVTPGNLSLQEKFYESSIKEKVFKNPIVYFADTLLTEYPKEDFATNAFAILEPASNLINQLQQRKEKGTVKLISISANTFTCDAETPGTSVLVLLQNYYPGWKAFVDEKETVIEKANTTFMCIQVPAGKHTISFIYQPTLIKYAWYVSLISLITLLTFLTRGAILSFFNKH